MLRPRHAILGLALFVAMLGDSWGQSQQPPPVTDQRPTEQGEPSSSEKTDTSKQTPRSQQPSATIEQAPSNVLKQHGTNDARNRDPEPEKSWWDKLWSDPNATFAGAVAMFTLALVIVGGYQSRQLRRSVNLLAQAERAVLHIIIENQNMEHVIRFTATFNNTPSMDDGDVSTRPFVQYRFKNYGKTPAIVKEISRFLVYLERLPAHPNYIPIDHVLKEQMLSAGDQTEQLECNLDPLLKLGETKRIIRGQSSIWFYGRVLYDDIFGAEHVHCFAWRYRSQR